MLERSRYLVISELSTVCRKSECMVEPLVDEALSKSCTKHTRSVTVVKPMAKPAAALVGH
jgi:hypothetical protein